jgi:hypothetical protein
VNVDVNVLGIGFTLLNVVFEIRWCLQMENKFVFRPNDPTSVTKLDVGFEQIKGTPCLSFVI